MSNDQQPSWFNAHKLTHDEVQKEYHTSLEYGLTDNQYQQKLQQFGLNKIPNQTPNIWWLIKKLLLHIFSGTVNILL